MICIRNFVKQIKIFRCSICCNYNFVVSKYSYIYWQYIGDIFILSKVYN